MDCDVSQIFQWQEDLKMRGYHFCWEINTCCVVSFLLIWIIHSIWNDIVSVFYCAAFLMMVQRRSRGRSIVEFLQIYIHRHTVGLLHWGTQRLIAMEMSMLSTTPEHWSPTAMLSRQRRTLTLKIHFMTSLRNFTEIGKLIQEYLVLST